MLLTFYLLQNAYDSIKACRQLTRLWSLRTTNKSKMWNGLSNFPGPIKCSEYWLVIYSVYAVCLI